MIRQPTGNVSNPLKNTRSDGQWNYRPINRRKNVSIPSPDVETHYNPPRQETGVQPRRDGHSSETMQEWTQRKLTEAKNYGKRL